LGGSSLVPAQGSVRSAVHKIADGFDLVRGQVPDERELVNALNVEHPPVRELAVQEDLSGGHVPSARAARHKEKKKGGGGDVREPRPFLGPPRHHRS
jgi:hypothetical protein